MLNTIKDSTLRTLRRWVPDTLISRKLDQADDNTASEYSDAPLEGTMAMCEILACGTRLRKTLRVDLVEADRNALFWIRQLAPTTAIRNWARDSSEYEMDVEHEAMMQEMFRKAWRGEEDIVVPHVYVADVGKSSIIMEFLPFQRLRDCSPGPRRKHAALTAARFFFDSIRIHHLLHGDISATNVLVATDGRFRCGMIDFGLSRQLSPEESEMLLAPREDSVTSRTLLGIWYSASQFSEELWVTEIWPVVMRGRDDPNACEDGTFVRSLVGLTRIACAAGIEWGGMLSC
jgi:hypothetical protein